jgi:hypothetical protein
MSSSFHGPRDLDAVLIHEPRRDRRKGTAARTKTKSAPARRRRASGGADSDEPIFIGDRAILELQHQLSLDPEIIPELPPRIRKGPGPGPMAVRLCVVGAIAALGAWGAVSLTSNPAGSDSAQGAQVSTAVFHVSASEAPAATPPPALAVAAKDEFSPPIKMPPTAMRQLPSTPVDVRAAPLNRDEITMLLKRGNAALTDGDISSARLLLRRAAEAGSAEAALALASTFDPLVIARLGTFGVQADVAKAREWYQRAAQLGSRAAVQQLAKFGRAGE